MYITNLANYTRVTYYNVEDEETQLYYLWWLRAAMIYPVGYEIM